MIEQCDLSERRACRLVGLSRDSYRHPLEANAMTQELSSKIVEIARAAVSRGHLRAVRTDIGPEFTSRVFIGWAQAHGIRHILIESVLNNPNFKC